MHNKYIKKTIETIRLFFRNDSIWKKKFSFVSEHKEMDMIWQKVHTMGFVTVPLKNLLARIWTKSGIKEIPIEETPHYAWIKDIIENKDDSNSRTIYYQYVKTYFPRENVELRMERTKKMIFSFGNKKNIHELPLVVSFPIKKTNNEYDFIIYDGAHRASIAKALGEKEMQCYITKIKKINIIKEYIKKRIKEPTVKIGKRFLTFMKIK
jgi:hypothetical protein